ncbi:MAG: glycerophosphodiester phosphodiesterase [Rubricoccaceae bacterium]
MPRPLLIAHRGASGTRPEHTLAAYALGAAMGADAIEPDLVPTRDGHLVARHENEISETTDVARHPEFANRRTTKVIDGLERTGWFTEDFELAEIRTLRAVERLPHLRPESASYNGQFGIPTLGEILTLIRQLEDEHGRSIGVYPEIKHPAYFASLGLDLEPRVADALGEAGYRTRLDLAWVQSFELASLRTLRGLTDLRLVYLVDLADGNRLTPDALAEIATVADVLGPHKHIVVPVGKDGALASPTELVRDAHAAGLEVHPWTVRAENPFLPPALRSSEEDADHGDLAAEVRALVEAGVDGLFSDHPDVAAAALGR